MAGDSQEKGNIDRTLSEDSLDTKYNNQIEAEDDNISIKKESKFDNEASYTGHSSANNSDDDDDDFDWNELDPEENVKEDEESKDRHFFLCLSRTSSIMSWICYIILTAISVAVCVAVFVTVKPQRDPTMASYNLALWFTFIAFMFCVTFVMQMIIESIPWFIKKLFGIFAPHKTEVLRARLAYYMDLRTYTKLVTIGAWSWGSWAFLRRNLGLPEGATQPYYVRTLEYVWECFFLLMIFIFIEKFILQLIVTSFHKKAYGERLYQNERALRILDKLKRKRSSTATPQDFLLQKIKKKYITTDKKPSASNNNSTTTVNNGSSAIAPKSIINNSSNNVDDEGNSKNNNNVKFPSNKNLDVLIPIPPVNTHEPSKNSEAQEAEKEKKGKRSGYFKSFSKKSKERMEEQKIEEINEAEEERMDRNTEDFENQNRPKLHRSNTGFSSISGNSYSNSNNSNIFQNYKKLVHESAFQNPITQAKQLAKRIYHNIMGSNPTRRYVIESDLYPFFGTIDAAREAFNLFDTDSNGDISRREMRAGCIRIYRDRKDLARSMRDMSQATGKLDVILMIVALCVWAIVVMAVFGVNVGTQLTPLWSAFIAASFIFGNSAKDAFESIIFVFVTHPFDTGDRIILGNENWIVNNVGLSVSTFLKWDGSVVYAKNSVLATQYIINCRRTGRTTEAIDIQISYHTPSDKIQILRDHMVKWCNQYPKLYTRDSCGANIVAIENLNRITLSFYFEHTKNWQEAGGRWLRHNNFMLELKDELQRLEIIYTNPVQPVVHKYPGEEEDSEENDDEEEEENISSEIMKNDKPRKRKPWSTTSSQNYASTGGSSGFGGDGSGSGGDAGATAGAAATATIATGLI